MFLSFSPNSLTCRAFDALSSNPLLAGSRRKVLMQHLHTYLDDHNEALDTSDNLDVFSTFSWPDDDTPLLDITLQAAVGTTYDMGRPNHQHFNGVDAVSGVTVVPAEPVESSSRSDASQTTTTVGDIILNHTQLHTKSNDRARAVYQLLISPGMVYDSWPEFPNPRGQVFIGSFKLTNRKINTQRITNVVELGESAPMSWVKYTQTGCRCWDTTAAPHTFKFGAGGCVGHLVTRVHSEGLAVMTALDAQCPASVPPLPTSTAIGLAGNCPSLSAAIVVGSSNSSRSKRKRDNFDGVRAKVDGVNVNLWRPIDMPVLYSVSKPDYYMPDGKRSSDLRRAISLQNQQQQHQHQQQAVKPGPLQGPPARLDAAARTKLLQSLDLAAFQRFVCTLPFVDLLDIQKEDPFGRGLLTQLVTFGHQLSWPTALQLPSSSVQPTWSGPKLPLAAPQLEVCSLHLGNHSQLHSLDKCSAPAAAPQHAAGTTSQVMAATHQLLPPEPSGTLASSAVTLRCMELLFAVVSCERGPAGIAQLLAQVNNNGTTALHTAAAFASSNNLAVYKLLLEHTSLDDVLSAASNNQWLVYHVAANKGHVEAVRLYAKRVLDGLAKAGCSDIIRTVFYDLSSRVFREGNRGPQVLRQGLLEWGIHVMPSPSRADERAHFANVGQASRWLRSHLFTYPALPEHSLGG